MIVSLSVRIMISNMSYIIVRLTFGLKTDLSEWQHSR